MKSGSAINVSNVIAQLSLNMITSVTTSWMTFCSTVPSVLVTVCCAPTTSLFKRDCNAPVCVRVKNAMGMRCTWSKSLTRRS